jgi:hypothetical protein
MPTFSNCVKCNTCNSKYRIRYGLGNNFPQKAVFICENCSSEITTGIKKYGENIYFEGATYLKGVDGFDDPTIKVVNLHPELPITEGHESDPTYFSTIDHFPRFHNNTRDIFKFRELQTSWSTFPEQWKNIEPPLRLLTYKDQFEMKSIFGLTFIEFSALFNDWVNTFCIDEWVNRYSNINAQLNTLIINEKNVKDYFKANIQEWIEKIFEICSTYMKVRENFESTILFQKIGSIVPSSTKASVKWSDIKGVYGDMYEIVTDLLLVITFAHNIKSGRNFNEFLHDDFSLEKYLKTDKAKRGLNFESDFEFKKLLAFIKPSLRNGTHHKKCKYFPYTNEIELGTGKGGANPVKISLIEYVSNCNELFATGIYLSNIILKIIA